MKDKIKKHKKILITIFSIIFLGIISILLSINSGDISEKSNKYNGLTKVYNENILSKKNGISQPDTVITDENLNIVEVKPGDSNINMPNDVVKDTDKISEEVVSDSVIKNKIVEISDILNKKDLVALKSLFNIEYINDFQINETSLEVAFPFKNEVALSILDIEKDFDGNRRIVTVKIDEPSSGNHLIKYFTFFEDGTIAPIQITTEVDLDYKTQKNGVNFSITKKIITRGGTIFLLDIENNSDRIYSPQKVVGKDGITDFNVSLLNLSPRFRDIGAGLNSSLILKVDNIDPKELWIVDKNYLDVEESLNLLINN